MYSECLNENQIINWEMCCILDRFAFEVNKITLGRWDWEKVPNLINFVFINENLFEYHFYYLMVSIKELIRVKVNTFWLYKIH